MCVCVCVREIIHILSYLQVFVWHEKEGERATVEELEEQYCLVNPVVKDATLVATVLQHSEDNPRNLILIFTDTCKRTQVIAR